MRVSPILPEYRAITVKKNDRISSANNVNYAESTNSVLPVAMSIPIRRMSGVVLTFTGADKDVHQFASYAPENKRYGIKQYNQGGLGVVSQEAPQSWRMREGADVRDFSPYHTFGNEEGGIRVIKLKKEKGKYVESYPASEFITAKSGESLADVAKRLNIEEKDLAFVIQQEPDKDGMSKILRLEDSGIQGSFVRPSETSIFEKETVPYRIFRAVDIQDPVYMAVEKYKKGILSTIEKPFRDPITVKVNEEFAEELKKAKALDEANYQEQLARVEQHRKEHPEEMISVYRSNGEEKKIQTKIKEEIEKRLKGDKDAQAKIKEQYLERLNSDEVHQAIAKITEHSAPEVKERNAAYFVYTPGTAKLGNAYGAGVSGTYGTYGTTGQGGVSTNVMYADNNRAFVEIMPHLNTPEHGNYNPANWWLHDRPAFMVLTHAADKSNFGDSYYNGLKAHGTFHNPGRDYQGAVGDPFEFFRMVANETDIDALNKHPQAETLKKIESHWGSATADERRFANQILRPFMANFLDDFVDEANDLRTFNISMGPVAGVKLNPDNMSAGTVSMNYGKEMKSLATPDIAQFLTKKLAEIKTIDITNGSTPANLKLDDATANFCQSGEINGLTKLKSGFTPYKYKPVIEDGKLISDNIEEVLTAKKSNTKWLMNSLAEAFQRGGQSGVVKMFCTDAQMKKGATVIGHLSAYEEGDMLFMGWGRADRQKGYPSTFQALLDFLKDPNVPQDVKKHTKVLVGAGTWQNGTRDYDWLKDIIRQIEELDGGIYKGNACYVNNFFSNRLVGCATHTLFTSRFEPCGITPLESFASGTPVVSTKTGGAPDFVSATRGWLTKHAYLRSLEDMGIDPSKYADLTGEELGNTIDTERMKANASEVRECLITATEEYGINPKNGELSEYAKKVRDALNQKIDWHENSEYNGGKTANERYMTEVFDIPSGMEGRNKNPLNRLVDKFGIADPLVENASKVKNKWTKIIIGTGMAIAAVGTAAYVYMKQKSPKSEQKPLNKIA